MVGGVDWQLVPLTAVVFGWDRAIGLRGSLPGFLRDCSANAEPTQIYAIIE